MNLFKRNPNHKPKTTALDMVKYIGPGLIVTVGFIDPGNWATNIAAGSSYGYALLWVITISTVMLIILQHNAAHLGIVTGECLSEATSKYIKPSLKNFILITAVIACISTALAELLGSAIALNMLFKIPIKIGVIIIFLVVCWMLFGNSYKRLEKWIIGFVSLIGLSFIVELLLVHVNYKAVAIGLVKPVFPKGSIPVIMSVLGAVVMPHNLFLHSEIIQSRKWNLKDESVIKKQLKFEFLDTIISMTIGWAINGAMIILAASTFFADKINVSELSQAQVMLKPLVGNLAAIIFAVVLLFSGISAAVTAGMAGGSIFAGIFSEPYDIKDSHSKTGVIITLLPAVITIFFITDPFKGLIYSQMLLSIQLPITIFTQLYLTSSKKVMGKYVNSNVDNILLWGTAIAVTILNLALVVV
ncbi:MAG: Nramp family divalent metal transporter [Clostridium sp.]|nr:Nramp family divalent metal transporter [Clostridium sp.]